MTTLEQAQAALETAKSEVAEKSDVIDTHVVQRLDIVLAALAAGNAAATALDDAGEGDDADDLRDDMSEFANDFAYEAGMEFDGDLTDPGFWTPSTC